MDYESKSEFENFKSYTISAVSALLIILIIIAIVWFATSAMSDSVSKFVGYQVASDALGDNRPSAFLTNKYADQSGNHRQW